MEQKNKDNTLSEQQQNALRVFGFYVEEGDYDCAGGRRDNKKRYILPDVGANIQKVENFYEFGKTNIFKRKLTLTDMVYKLWKVINSDSSLSETEKIDRLAKLLERSTKNKISLRLRIGGSSFDLTTKIGTAKQVVGWMFEQIKRNAEHYGNPDLSNPVHLSIIDYPDEGLVNPSAMVRGIVRLEDRIECGERILQMRGCYILVSPKSNDNCFYHCLAMWVALNPGQDQVSDLEKFNDQTWIVDTAKDYKEKIGNVKDYADLDDVQKACDHYNLHIDVYDNLFGVKKAFIPEGYKPKRGPKSPLLGQHIKVQFRKGHCYLMLSKTQFPDFVNEEIEQQEQEDYSETKAIKPRKRRCEKLSSQ